MAVFQNDPFPGVDYNAYQGWERVYGPNGQVYYVVPGNPGYVYDPVASAATGRKVFRANPSEAMKAQKEQEDQQRKLVAQQEFNQSPVGQLLPVAGSVGGMVLAHELMTPAASPLETALAARIGGQAAIPAAATPGAAAASGALGTGGAAGAGGASLQSVGAVGEVVPEGGAISVSGAVPPPPGFLNTPVESLGGITPVQGLGAVGAGLGAYEAYKGIEKGDPLTAGMGGLGMGLGINAMGFGLGPWGWGAMAIPAVAAAFGIGKHKTTKEYQADRWGDIAESSDSNDYWKNQANTQFQVMQGDAAGKFIGSDGVPTDEEWSLDKVKNMIAAGDPQQTAMFRGVLGHQRTFGNDWSNYTPQQQDMIIQALAREGLYKGDHGDVVITDQDRARKIKDEVLAGSYQTDGFNTDAPPAVRGTAPATLPDAAAAGAMHRSSTRSPGIDLNGNRIRY